MEYSLLSQASTICLFPLAKEDWKISDLSQEPDFPAVVLQLPQSDSFSLIIYPQGLIVELQQLLCRIRLPQRSLLVADIKKLLEEGLFVPTGKLPEFGHVTLLEEIQLLGLDLHFCLLELLKVVLRIHYKRQHSGLEINSGDSGRGLKKREFK